MNAFMSQPVRGLLGAAGVLAASAAIADTTAATLHGHVRSSEGAPVAEARVEIVHRPSGTTRTAVSSANGAFYQSGLRVGGPYEIRIARPGYRDRRLPLVSLRPGTQAPLAVTLWPPEIEEVVVTAGPPVSARDLNNGVGSVFTAADIADQPSVTWDVIRTLLRDPLAQSAGERAVLRGRWVEPRVGPPRTTGTASRRRATGR